MLFISIPLILIGISVLGILAVLVRKFPATAKIAQNPGGPEAGIWKSFFPELDAKVRQIHFGAAFRSVLAELEKAIRKLRLFIVATERLFDSLIHRIRRVRHQQSVKLEMKESQSAEAAPPDTEDSRMRKALDAGISDVHVKPKADEAEEERVRLKSREAELIEGITLNPKDSALYAELADIYIKSDNWTDAKESLQAALRLKPDNQELAQKLSLVLQKLLKK